MKRALLCFTAMLWLVSAGAQNQNALDFDGVDDFVTVPNASALIAGSQTLSLTCWVYPANTSISFPNYDGFAGFRNDTSCDFYLVQHGPTAVEARFRGSGGVAGTTTFGNLLINQWQHLVITYNGNNLVLYHNGVQVNSTLASGTISLLTKPFLIGDLLYVYTHFYLQGKVDEVSLWNKTLTQEEILDIYNCAVDPTASNLLLYYKFNQGIAGGNNAGITTLTPTTGTLIGDLTNFTLTGNTSNWVSGISTPINYLSDTICQGQSIQFGNLTLTTPGTYTQTFQTTSGCDSVVQLTLAVTSVNTALSVAGITLTAQLAGAAYQWVDCNNNFAHVPGATQQVFVPSVNGLYAVIVTKDGCSDTSVCVPVTTVGLSEGGTLPGARIYPNPLTDESILDLGRTCHEVNISVFGIDGRKMSELNMADIREMKLHPGDFPTGVYMVKVSTEAGGMMLKMIR